MAETTRTVPLEPTDEMLNNARDWSYAKYGKPIGNDDAIGCYQAMIAAAPAEPDPAADPVQMKRGRWNLADDGFGMQSADDGVYCYYADAQERVRELERRQQRAAGFSVKRCVCLFDETVFADKPIEECGYHKATSERADKAEADNKRLRDRHDDQGRWYREAIKQVKDQFAAERDALAKDAERLQRERDRAVEQQAIQIEGRDSAWHYIFKLRTKIILLQAQLDQRSGRDAT